MSRLWPATKQDIKRLEIKLMAVQKTLDEVLVSVYDNHSLIGSLSALTAGLKQQVADAVAGSDAATKAKVNLIFAAVEANKAQVIAAITANTPVAYNAQG